MHFAADAVDTADADADADAVDTADVAEGEMEAASELAVPVPEPEPPVAGRSPAELVPDCTLDSVAAATFVVSVAAF